MAVESCNTRFDWCYRLLETKGNYNRNECCNIVKNYLQKLQGVDKKFLNNILSTSNDAFRFKKYYFPVYSVEATITYTWDVRTETYDEITETHNTERKTFSNDFYKGIYDGCKPAKFVGRNDERFYKLSHVDDLDAGVYNNSCTYTSSQLTSEIKSYATNKSPSTDADTYLNEWTATALLVPIAVIGCTYEGKDYEFVVNMHNGYGHYDYLVSEEVSMKAVLAKRLSFWTRIAAILVSVFAWMSVVSETLIASLLASGLVIFLIVKSFTINHKKEYFLDLFGKKGVNFSILKAIKESLTLFLLSVGATILLMILFL